MAPSTNDQAGTLRSGPVIWRPVCAKPNKTGDTYCDRSAEHLGGCSWELGDRGYLLGIRNCRSGIAGFDQKLDGFDQATVRKLRQFVDGMYRHALERLSQEDQT